LLSGDSQHGESKSDFLLEILLPMPWGLCILQQYCTFHGVVMNKSELVKALADQANISLDEATLVVNTFVDSMKDSLLEGGRVEIRGFGSFKVKEYGSYAGRNPRTGEKVAVEPKRLPFFRAGKELKEYLNA